MASDSLLSACGGTSSGAPGDRACCRGRLGIAVGAPLQDIRATLLAGDVREDTGALAGVADAATVYPGAIPTTNLAQVVDFA